MKRMLIFAVLSAFILGGMAYATETRVMTMGDANNIVKDDANIWLYPSTINYYPKLFIAEYDPDFYNESKDGADEELFMVGAHLLFGEDGESPMVLGAYFDREDYRHDLLYYDKARDFACERMTLFYGREISEMPFGFAFSYYSSGYKNEDEDVASNEDESLARYEFGFGLSPMEKKLDLTLAIALTTWTDQDYYNAALGVVDYTKPSGNMDLAFMGRYWMDPMGKYTLVPHASFVMSKEGVEWYGEDAGSWVLGETDEQSWSMIDLGLGFNYEADEDVLVVGDFGFAMENYKYTVDYADAAVTDPDDYEDKWLSLPYFKIGLDANILKWLDFRCGATKYWSKDTYEPNTTVKRTWSEVDTETYLGFGLNWGNLTIDAEMDGDFLEEGPYFISGNSDHLTERVSLKYAF